MKDHQITNFYGINQIVKNTKILKKMKILKKNEDSEKWEDCEDSEDEYQPTNKVTFQCDEIYSRYWYKKLEGYDENSDDYNHCYNNLIMDMFENFEIRRKDGIYNYIDIFESNFKLPKSVYIDKLFDTIIEIIYVLNIANRKFNLSRIFNILYSIRICYYCDNMPNVIMIDHHHLYQVRNYHYINV